uniref:AraC family transcriptional regulator n=1 Tax=Ascaris lumbricoides TaxID=6252 RepID=A0A0M3I7L4_ASCLU
MRRQLIFRVKASWRMHQDARRMGCQECTQALCQQSPISLVAGEQTHERLFPAADLMLRSGTTGQIAQQTPTSAIDFAPLHLLRALICTSTT